MKAAFYSLSVVLIHGLLAATANAHAFLDTSSPKVGSTVSAPSAVSITYTMDPEPGQSVIQVYNAAGAEVDRKDTHGDPSDDKTLIVHLAKLPAGLYKVAWKVVCTDGHHTKGAYTFTVK